MLLDNESIVQLLNVIDMKDFTIMVMEYMSGGDMQTYLDQQCHMTEKEAQCPFRQLLSALNHCHEWGIVHRNLKPSNLLLDVDQKVKIDAKQTTFVTIPVETNTNVLKKLSPQEINTLVTNLSNSRGLPRNSVLKVKPAMKIGKKMLKTPNYFTIDVSGK